MKKIIALFLALCCASVLMAQDFSPVEDSNDILGKWYGEITLDEEAVKSMMGELPEGLSFLRFSEFSTISLEFKASKNDVKMKDKESDALYIKAEEPIPQEIIDLYNSEFSQHGYKCTVSKDKKQVTFKTQTSTEQKLTFAQFEYLCQSALQISSDKKQIALIVNNVRVVLDKKK